MYIVYLKNIDKIIFNQGLFTSFCYLCQSHKYGMVDSTKCVLIFGILSFTLNNLNSINSLENCVHFSQYAEHKKEQRKNKLYAVLLDKEVD